MKQPQQHTAAISGLPQPVQPRVHERLSTAATTMPVGVATSCKTHEWLVTNWLKLAFWLDKVQIWNISQNNFSYNPVVTKLFLMAITSCTKQTA